jgi:hypothetical protein
MPWPPDEAVTPQLWLVADRPANAWPPRLIIIHATRGETMQELQYDATKNWFQSASNCQGDGSWGGCAHAVISHTGQLCRFISDAQTAHYAAGFGANFPPLGWSCDDFGLSLELAQSSHQEPFAQATIDRAAEVCAAWCAAYGIPPVHVTKLDQRGREPQVKGIVGHDETENGTKLHKSDPGDKFPWNDFIAKVQAIMRGVPVPDAPITEDRLRQMLLDTLVRDYRVVRFTPMPTNAFGQPVVEIVNKDGTPCDPRTIVAIRS